MKLFIFTTVLISSFAYAANPMEKFNCSPLMDRTGDIKYPIVGVTVVKELVPVGPMTPAFENKFSLEIDYDTENAEILPLNEVPMFHANDQIQYTATNDVGAWTLTEQSEENHVLKLVAEDTREYRARCVKADDDKAMNDADVIEAVKNHAQEKINSTMWVGAWIPKISATKLMRVKSLSAKSKKYQIEITLDFGGPIAHQSKVIYEALVKNDKVIDIKELE